MTGIPAIPLVPGEALGEVLVLAEPLSFWGGYDAASGRIIDRWHPDHGKLCAGRILVMTASRGSSSGSSVLAEAIRAGTGPAALVLRARDAIVTVGAMVAAELYGAVCPVVVVGERDWARVVAAKALVVKAGQEGNVSFPAGTARR
jgi:predicted aconitase with swiveling domain